MQMAEVRAETGVARVVNYSEGPRAVNIKADHTIESFGPLESLDEVLPAWDSGTTELCIGWIDVSRLTRECLTSAVARAQPLFVIIPFESISDCTNYRGRMLDLIIYHSRESGTVGLEDVATLRAAFATVQIVVLSDASAVEPAIAREVLTRGASGFILTDSTSLQMVVSAISLVSSGGTFVPRDFLFMEREPAPLASSTQLSEQGRLTQREMAVLGLMKHGKPNKIIANELGMSASTVKVHVRHIMRKMGAANRTQAALNADRMLGTGRDRAREPSL